VPRFYLDISEDGVVEIDADGVEHANLNHAVEAAKRTILVRHIAVAAERPTTIIAVRVRGSRGTLVTVLMSLATGLEVVTDYSRDDQS
jgi:hypothetical protein